MHGPTCCRPASLAARVAIRYPVRSEAPCTVRGLVVAVKSRCSEGGQHEQSRFLGIDDGCPVDSTEERDTPDWSLVARSYQQRCLDAPVVSGIPRIIHQIWLGSQVPELYANWGTTFRKLNPDFEYRLWTDREIAAFGLKNQRAYDESTSYGVKSDLARYEILERLGGVYADTDFECLADFGSLVDSTDFFAGLMYGSHPVINNGLIGCRPHHPIMNDLVAELSEPFSGNDGMAVLNYCGPGKFTRGCLEYLRREPESKAVILPTTYLYPFPNRNIAFKDLQKAREWVRPESLAIHYWEISWRTHSWKSRLFARMKKYLPEGLVRLIYRLIKGKP